MFLILSSTFRKKDFQKIKIKLKKVLTNRFFCDRILNVQANIAELCNGSTADSDSVCWGSNPYSAAKKMTYPKDRSFFFFAFISSTSLLVLSPKVIT